MTTTGTPALPAECSMIWADIERLAEQGATITLKVGDRVISGTWAASLLHDYRKALAGA